LDQFTPEEFDERFAAERVDGSPAEWIERIAVILKLGFTATAMSKVEPDMFDPLRPRSDNTKATRGSPFQASSTVSEGQAVSPAQGAAMFASVFGVSTK